MGMFRRGGSPMPPRRPREYLTAAEVERLIAAARSCGGRHGHRDATMILIAYRHGLRASELVRLRWDMLDLAQGQLHVTRLKNGRPSVHTVRGSELRALRRRQREQRPPSPYLFTTERRAPMSAAGFRKQLAVIAIAAGLPRPSAYAASCLRLRARPWAARYPRHPGVARASQHPAHHPLHRAHHPSVQGFLAAGGLARAELPSGLTRLRRSRSKPATLRYRPAISSSSVRGITLSS